MLAIRVVACLATLAAGTAAPAGQVTEELEQHLPRDLLNTELSSVLDVSPMSQPSASLFGQLLEKGLSHGRPQQQIVHTLHEQPPEPVRTGVTQSSTKRLHELLVKEVAASLDEQQDPQARAQKIANSLRKVLDAKTLAKVGAMLA